MNAALLDTRARELLRLHGEEGALLRAPQAAACYAEGHQLGPTHPHELHLTRKVWPQLSLLDVELAGLGQRVDVPLLLPAIAEP